MQPRVDSDPQVRCPWPARGITLRKAVCILNHEIPFETVAPLRLRCCLAFVDSKWHVTLQPLLSDSPTPKYTQIPSRIFDSLTLNLGGWEWE